MFYYLHISLFSGCYLLTMHNGYMHEAKVSFEKAVSLAWFLTKRGATSDFEGETFIDYHLYK